MGINKKGFTLLEMVVVLAIFSLLSLAIAWILINSLRSNTTAWDQLQAENDAGKTLKDIVNEARRAESSDIGAYALSTTTAYELAFYANIDNDSFKELVRFKLVGTDLTKGITKPSGNPLDYLPATESVTTIARDVVNIGRGDPLFYYYDKNYNGTQAALTEPINITEVRMVKVRIEIDRNPAKSPIILTAESMTQIRSLGAGITR
ncbi:MAG: type II secretion system protein [Patescibacteria group bacterium]